MRHHSQKLRSWSQILTYMRARTTIQGKLGARARCQFCKWLSLVIFSRLVKYPTNLSVVSFQNTRSASPKLSVELFKDLVLISGSGYTMSQQLTACLNEFVSGGKHRSSLFGTFWVIFSCMFQCLTCIFLNEIGIWEATRSNLRSNFQTFPGGACPQTRLDHGNGRHPSSCMANWPYRFFLASYSPEFGQLLGKYRLLPASLWNEGLPYIIEFKLARTYSKSGQCSTSYIHHARAGMPLVSQADPLLQEREGSGELCIQAVSHWNAISQMS